MATGTYEVTAYGPIARREQNSTRRRAGIEFGREPIIVTTEPGVAGAVLVTEAQLDAILGDECLRQKAVHVEEAEDEGESKRSAEGDDGLGDDTADGEEEQVVEDEEGEEPAQVAPEPAASVPAEHHHQPARRGRPRKPR